MANILESANRHRKIVNKGVSGLQRIVNAGAVFALICQTARLTPSGVLKAFLDAYQSLLHPLIDNTVGLIPDVFGYQLLPWFKDALVIYALIGAAIVRGNIAVEEDSDKKLLLQAYVLPGIFWPVIAAIFAFVLIATLVIPAAFATREGGNLKAVMRRYLRFVVVELVYVLAIVVAAIILTKAQSA